MIYPWQNQQWQRLQAQGHKLPHSLLLHGPEGLGKNNFALSLAKSLLCLSDDANGNCKHCKSCNLLEAGTHPDFILLAPEEAGKLIKVDSVRELTDKINQTGQISSRRVIIISPAEAMNPAAANALLKTLEEPAPGVFIILVSHQLDSIIPTIRSRCQLCRFYPTLDETTVAWLAQQCPEGKNPQQALQQVNGLPILALRLMQGEGVQQEQLLIESLMLLKAQHEKLFDVAKQLSELPLALLLPQCAKLVSSMVRYSILGQSECITQPAIRQLAANINLSSLFNFYRYLLNQTHRLSSSINQQMLLEQMLVHWCELSCHEGKIYAC